MQVRHCNLRTRDRERKHEEISRQTVRKGWCMDQTKKLLSFEEAAVFLVGGQACNKRSF